jgi:hypothetical protein
VNASALEKLAAQVDDIQITSGRAILDLMSERWEEAEKNVRAVNELSQFMAQRLHVEGVRVPEVVGACQAASAPVSDELDLGALASLSSPTAATMLDRLRDLLPLAEMLDTERGHAMPEEYTPAPGESRGTDVAEAISLLILQLTRDVEGARGRGLE